MFRDVSICFGGIFADFLLECLQLTVAKDAEIVGLLNWFDTYFEYKCDNPSMFSTGPMTKETHWKQSAFYLSRAVNCKAGDKIVGRVNLRKHHRHHRHLEIVIEWQHVPKSGEKTDRVFQNFEFQ
jgi:protein arginine N-methyltransferase 1